MDIQEIIKQAKERIMTDGEHAPTLFAESESQDISLFLIADLLECTSQRQSMFFSIGRRYGTGIRHLYFVCEAWTSRNTKYAAPSQDPNRKEIIMVNHLDAVTMESRLHTFEILRTGNTVDLLPYLGEMAGMEVVDRLLPCFVAGSMSAGMSDERVAWMIDRALRRNF